MRKVFRYFLIWVLSGGWLGTPLGQPADGAAPGSFVRLVPLPAPRLVTSAAAYPGGAYEAVHLVDGKVRTEYSSNSQGTNTFIEFDFGKPTSVAAFRHVDRNDPATVASSELDFLDAAGGVISTVPVMHVNQRGGVTLFALPAPVTTTRVRWRVTGLGPQGHGTVGGAEISFFTGGPEESIPRGITIETRFYQVLERKRGALLQPAQVILDYPYARPVDAMVRLADAEPRSVQLVPGTQTLDYSLPERTSEKEFSVAVVVAGQTAASHVFTRRPVRPWEIHILPHSHVDIGYTALQGDVERKQNENIERALELIRATADYPVEARFKWNVEVLWPVENFLRTALPEQREAFLTAVRTGSVGLDGLYGNILTGLCRPEELLRSVSYATRLSNQGGMRIESAMISDVPGYTWSTVPALVHGGVKYFSFAPNYFDRMGGTMVTWQNKPFWWQGPDGRSRLLSWCPARGYALGHILGQGEALTRFIPDYLIELERQDYPYDLTHVRWSVHGDNGAPDDKISAAVRDWNMRYAYPRLRLSTTAETFAEFERRYGKQLPIYGGDYTPYWEDGAGSSARETALNRATAERLLQAETLWVMRYPGRFPAEAFQEAWRNVLLYSEHTWGAHNSISQPDAPFVRDQWRVKQGFALEADRQSRQLLEQVLGGSEAPGQAVDVFNTCSWERTDLVTLPPDLSAAGDRVLDEKGQTVPAQRLSTGELVFMARDVPAFASRRFQVAPGAAVVNGGARAQGAMLVHPELTLHLDEQTGAIASLRSRITEAELVDAKAATALNDYFYVPGTNTQAAQRNGSPRITVKEKGPLLASLLVQSDAPGCKKLSREVRIIDGLDRVELINTVDKEPVRAKEGLHFGFGFNVPGGTTWVGRWCGPSWIRSRPHARTGSVSSAGLMFPTTSSA
jgi:alpha-mannosidase